MLDAIRRFMTELTGRKEAASVGEDDVQLAAAALLFHVVAIDGVVSPDECARLADLLQARFNLDQPATQALIREAETADAEAVDLYSFTRVLKEKLGPADRERVIEMMWSLVYADGTVHEFEDNVVWRVAELLGVSTQARIRLKQSVRDRGG
jgi:uncharacterized tellurite resistance protein B-like protein